MKDWYQSAHPGVGVLTDDEDLTEQLLDSNLGYSMRKFFVQ